MDDINQEVAQLRADAANLRNAMSTAIMMAKVSSEFASALAATHPHPLAVLQAFNAVADASDGAMQYSKATDADLDLLELLREAVRVQLQPPAPSA